MPKYSYRSALSMSNAVRETVEVVMDEVYERFLNHLFEIIERDVYLAYEPEFYERTYDLMNPQNWEIKKWKYGDQIKREIYFKGQNLTSPSDGDAHNPMYWIHGHGESSNGNVKRSPLDAQTFLEILNNERPQGDNGFGFAHPKRKPFWDDFEKYCDDYYTRLMRNALQRHGFIVS